VLVPADLERRHNHTLVLTAFAQFRSRHARSRLKLVCGAASSSRLSAAVTQMRLQDSVRFTGPLTRDRQIALMERSYAVIVPSLYETIGEDVLQAMALGRALLCSRLPSLLDLTGDAALSFDQHQPAELCALLERIDADAVVARRYRGLARQRIEALDDAPTVAQSYVDILRQATQCHAASR
jgi:glycosyltransferase involved in cell wall biosynthesis